MILFLDKKKYSIFCKECDFFILYVLFIIIFWEYEYCMMDLNKLFYIIMYSVLWKCILEDYKKFLKYFVVEGFWSLDGVLYLMCDYYCYK